MTKAVDWDVEQQTKQRKQNFVSQRINSLLATGYFFMPFLWSADFFQNRLFKKILSGVAPKCQTVLIKIRPDTLSGLIQVQSVCIGYQQRESS